MSRLRLLLVGIVSIGIAHGHASTNVPAPAQVKPVALKGATIHPVSGPEIPGGTIVFEKGKITAIGKDAATPQGAEIVDLAGKHIYPGLISANTVLGLIEIGAVRATRDVEEAGAINPNARSVSSINPDSELIPVARSNGLLTALSVPEGGLLSGQSAVLRMEGWTPEEMEVRSPVAMHLRWPNMTIDRDPRAAKPIPEQQKDIDKAQKQIRDAFQIARSYWQARKNPTPDFKSDARWEAMMPVFDGKLPVFVHAATLAQMKQHLPGRKKRR